MSSYWKDRKDNNKYTPEQLLSLIWEYGICPPLPYIPFTDLRRNYPEFREDLTEIHDLWAEVEERKMYLYFCYLYILDKEGFTES
jgi:hypothetical protein